MRPARRMSCQTKCLPFGSGTLWKLLADSIYRGYSPLKFYGDVVCVLKQLVLTVPRALRGYSAASLGDHVMNGWKVARICFISGQNML